VARARRLVVLPSARRDMAEAFDWYEQQRAGLGDQFLHGVDACFDSIRKNPELYEVVHEGYRRALLRRFPYAVFYEPMPHEIVVYAVFHGAQDPEKWRRRLP
jgi:plasmid stabilization system protein ParE